MGEHLAGAAHAALHLVKDQQQPVCVAQRAHLFKVSIRHGTDAAFALHRFDHDGGCGIGDRRAKRLHIAKFDMFETGEQRAEAFGHFLGPCRRDPGR